MTAREKYLATMAFDLSAPPPKWEMAYWISTIERWRGEGMTGFDGDDAEVVDSYEQQTCCPAPCFGLFHGVGDAVDGELQVAEAGDGIYQIRCLQLADLFSQQPIGPQQLVLACGDSLRRHHARQ